MALENRQKLQSSSWRSENDLRPSQRKTFYAITELSTADN